MKGLFITYTCLLGFSVVTGHCFAGAKVVSMVLRVQNSGEPYGCNPPVKEFSAAHGEDTSGQHDMVLQNYAFKNPPQGKLITLFNPQGRKIGCIVNPDLSAKEHKVVVLAQNYPAEGEKIAGKSYSYIQDDLQKMYVSGTHLKEYKLNDQRDMFSLKYIHFAEEKIEEIMEEADVNKQCDKNTSSRFNFFKEESYNGKVDFFAQKYIQRNATSPDVFEGETLFAADNGVYNPHDFGNYLWGTAIARSCLPCPVGRAAAHYNNLLNMCKDNEAIKQAREAEGKKCRIELDSPVDQDAIRKGCHGLFNNREQTKMTCGDEIAFNENSSSSHKGQMAYHRASNGSKIFELKVDGVQHQFIISADEKGRKIESFKNNQSQSSSSFIDIDTKYHDLSDEELLGKVLGNQFNWTTDPASLALSQSYPKEDMSFSDFVQRKLKVVCGSVNRFEVRGAQKKCLASGGKYNKATKSEVSYELTFNVNDQEKMLRTKIDLLRRGINRKFSQRSEKAISLIDAYQCTCKNQVIDSEIDECVQDTKTTEKPANETLNQ
jgi:hypothetical protein